MNFPTQLYEVDKGDISNRTDETTVLSTKEENVTGKLIWVI